MSRICGHSGWDGRHERWFRGWVFDAVNEEFGVGYGKGLRRALTRGGSVVGGSVEALEGFGKPLLDTVAQRWM